MEKTIFILTDVCEEQKIFLIPESLWGKNLKVTIEEMKDEN